MRGAQDEQVWQDRLLKYSSRRSVSSSELLSDIKQRIKDVPSADNSRPMDIDQQYRLIMQLPNWPKWQIRKDSGLKMDNYFAPSSSSPRSQFIGALMDGSSFEKPIDHCYSILAAVLDGEYCLSGSLPTRQTLEKRRKIKRSKTRPTKADVCQSLDVVEQELPAPFTVDQPPSLQLYVKELLLRGTLLWRVRTHKKSVMCMNDYNIEKAEFKVHYHFIVAWRKNYASLI